MLCGACFKLVLFFNFKGNLRISLRLPLLNPPLFFLIFYTTDFMHGIIRERQVPLKN